MKQTLTVEKIGGTSMSAMKEVLSNIVFFERSGEQLYNRVFVVSAYSGVTDMLLENKKNGAPGVYHRIAHYQGFQKALKHVASELKSINSRFESLGLDLAVANQFIENRIKDAENYLNNLASILASGYAGKDEILCTVREILASIGESHSAFNLANILKQRNLSVRFIDLSGFDDHKPYTIDRRIKSAFKGIDLNTTICVVTGYAKGTEGIMREFDRGYSEVTFCKIAELLKPAEAIIHKEFHLSTADPNLVGKQNCRPIGFTNYDIADQLADVGMEAIHPKACKPLEINGIDLRIKNTFEPGHPGTLITRSYLSSSHRVEVIAGTSKVLMIDIYDPLMVGSVGSDLKIMQIFFDHKVSYVFKVTSANSISIVIWEKDNSKKLIDKMQDEFERITVQKIAIVCMMGSNMDKPGLIARSSAALTRSKINIKSAGFAFRNINVQFLVDREDFKNAVIALNQSMF